MSKSERRELVKSKKPSRALRCIMLPEYDIRNVYTEAINEAKRWATSLLTNNLPCLFLVGQSLTGEEPIRSEAVGYFLAGNAGSNPVGLRRARGGVA